MSIAKKCLENAPEEQRVVPVCNLRALPPATTRALIVLAKAAFAEMDRIQLARKGKEC